MKRLIITALLAIAASAFAGPDDIVFVKRNSTDTGSGQIIPSHPTTAPGLMTYDPATLMPTYTLPGSCLLISSGMLALTTGCTPVNPDWNATTGLAQILNKPTIPAAQVNSDWTATSGITQILNKPSTFTPSAHTHSTSDIISGLLDVARIPALAISQTSGLQAALDAKQGALTLTTTGSGAATLVGNTLNVPTPAAASPFNFGAINTRTFAASTAYQATDPAKAAIAKVSPSCTASLSLTAGGTCTIQARIGASGLTCSTGTVVATWTNANTGTLTIGLGLNQLIGSPGNIELAIGEYFILCPTSGTFTLANGTDRSAG